ncbi:prephenate dehydrogenase/arogenate dehydrogenase family protein [Xenophilus arseniciresistens]|uniref:Prephenate dehydrogenase/arogenate dehydrogenase family protein n=1 Tax=Xenophilus arseniciresistens TaxID=1283306 RepID=A0AAE3N5Q7_9BURK|nr:prephenate dehydrogenase/arogenate dehydrogenase family protein [Xenophilus arseniciresistens]MDA7415044.1 prephenate dehydrogenase/arogenate dehydrogenase family protein [Xenophilus arseniciresistens]
MFEQLGLIGCGLIGGSFALALKRARLVRRVVGYSKSPSTTERARQLGVIDVEAPSALLAVSGADLVLVAVPVSASEATFRAIRHGLSPHAMLMDVGSTKCDVIAAAERGLHNHFSQYVPAHPIAGKEVAGVEHAEADLFQHRKVILTPVEGTRPALAQKAEQLWRKIGAQVLTMTPEAHDAAFAAVSHLPHLLAFAFVNAMQAQPDGKRYLELAGPGFRDFTRIAGGDPTVWRDILLANNEEVLRQSQLFRNTLLQMEAMISNGDAAALDESIGAARNARRQWPSAGRANSAKH